jgi:hypothetical protein
MIFKSRFLNYQNLVFKDEAGKPLNGQMVFTEGSKDPKTVGFVGHMVCFQNGKLHNDNGPAIIMHDGQEEEWKNGKFISVTKPPRKYWPKPEWEK